MYNISRLVYVKYGFTVEAIRGRRVVPMLSIPAPESTARAEADLKKAAKVDSIYDVVFVIKENGDPNSTSLYVEFDESKNMIHLGLDTALLGTPMLMNGVSKVTMYGYERRMTWTMLEVQDFQSWGIRNVLVEAAKQCEPDEEKRVRIYNDNKVVFSLETRDGRTLNLWFHDWNLCIGTRLVDGPLSEL